MPGSYQLQIDGALSNKIMFMVPDGQLSWRARAICTASGFLLLIGTVYTSPLTALLLPIILFPTVYFFYYHSSLPVYQRTSTEKLLWIYVGTAFPGTPILMLFQGVLLLPLVNLLFGSEKDFFWHEFETVKKDSDIVDDIHRTARAAFAAMPTYWAFVIYASFVCFAGVEEVLKYAMVVTGKRKRSFIHDKEYILYGAAAGLSFATLENIAYIVAECQSSSIRKVFLTLFERMALGAVFHPILGMLTAANLARRDLRQEDSSFLSITGPSILLHGLFDFVLFAHSAWRGHIGWIHPEDIGSTLVLVLLLAILIWTTLVILCKSLAELEAKDSVTRSSELIRVNI